MKTFTKLLLLLLVAACAAPFILKGPDGRPYLTLDRLKAPDVAIPDLPDLKTPYRKIKTAIVSNHEDQPVQVYKWRDESGVWHYSDQKAADGSSTVISVNPAQNQVHFEETPSRENASDGASTEHSEDAATQAPSSLLPTIGNAKRLMEKARGVNQLAEKRQREQDRIINE